MINGKKVIAVIPARGGSKSIPYKNIKLLMGKPLIAWSIEVAKKTKEIDRIIVSTEDDKIAKVGKKYGAEVIKRPDYLAEDDSLPIDLIKDLIYKQNIGESATYIVYLEPTSPLRRSIDIKKSLELLADITEGYSTVATFTEAELNPHRAWKIENGTPEIFISNANHWLPRQKQPKAYQLNGAVYCFLISSINQDCKHFFNGKIGAIIMPKERSIDIDDEIDFLIAESIMKKGSKETFSNT